MDYNRPDVVINAAGKVGGIYANNAYPAEFIYQNLTIAQNLIHSAHLYNVEKFIMLGSSCSYPSMVSQPIHESSLMDGKPEETNQWYTVAKIAGIKLCEAYRRQYGRDYISILPANLYGPGDNYDSKNSHVIPSLIKRFHNAMILKNLNEVIWGSGNPQREFMYVDDASDAIIFLLKNYSSNDIINIGTGEKITIKNLAQELSSIVGFTGDLIFDDSKPDGSPIKVLDVSKLHALGWHHKTGLNSGLKKTYRWFVDNLG